MARHRAVIAAAAVAAVAIIGGAAWFGTQVGTDENAQAGRQPGATATTAPPPTSVATDPPRSPAAAAAGPARAARQWLAGRYTLRASDAAPDAWIDRVADVSTPKLQTTLEKQYRGGSGGIAWQQFTEQRCSRTVTGLAAEQVPEAPATENSRWLRVSATAVTTCQIRPDDPPFPARQTVSTTLRLVRGDDGTWLVSDRTQAG